jgi:hypothetical protein
VSGWRYVSLAVDRLRSVRNLALLTIQPLEGTVFAVLGALALVGLPTAVATRYTGLAACVTFLAVLAALLAVAGYKLQRQHDQRMRPAFTLELRLEDLAGELVRNSGEYFDMRTGLIVRVTNSGPDAEFVARVENVTGARRFGTRKPLDVRYSVDHVAWIETANSRMLITRGQTASLRLAEAG